MNPNNDPKNPSYVSPYLASLSSLSSMQLRNKVRSSNSGRSVPSKSRPESGRKPWAQNNGLNVNGVGKPQKNIAETNQLSKGNLEKLEIAMKQLSFDSNPKTSKVKISPRASRPGLVKTSGRASKVDTTAGKNDKPKRTLTISKSQEKGVANNKKETESNNNRQASNSQMGDTLVPEVKSILKHPSKGKFGSGMPNWKKLFFNSGESFVERVYVDGTVGTRPKKNVKFSEKVLIHYIPYESRGSTEWQYNLMMARENVYHSLLTDPRINSLMSDLGLPQSSSAFPGSNSDSSGHNMQNSRLLRRQNYF